MENQKISVGIAHQNAKFLKRARVWEEPLKDPKRLRKDIQADSEGEGESEICSSRDGCFFYYEQGSWNDFPEEVSGRLFRVLDQGKQVAEVSIWGTLYLVNFALMLQMNVRTGFWRSIAWKDQQGRFFCPRFPVESFCHGVLAKISKFAKGLQMPTIDGFPSAREKVVENGTTRISKFAQCKGGLEALGDKVLKLEEESHEHRAIKDKFCSGLGFLAKDVKVTGIYRDMHVSTSGRVRKLHFEKHLELSGEDPNVKLAWHGTSKQGVQGIICHGFGQPWLPRNGSSYGIGVYLAPEDCSYISAVYSDIDEIGEQHVVLCRVILGRTELVAPGSTQFHPSSDSFDTGVDDTSNPTRYIVWSTHMNTHILPLYVVSFKLTPPSHDISLAMQGKLGSLPQAMTTCYGFVWEGLQLEKSAGCLVQSWGLAIYSLFCSSQTPPFDLPQVFFLQQTVRRNSPGKVPRSPWMTFSEMLSVLKRQKHLPSADLLLLEQEHGAVKAGKMSREEFVKKLKDVVGEKTLRDVMKMMVPSSVNESMGERKV